MDRVGWLRTCKTILWCSQRCGLQGDNWLKVVTLATTVFLPYSVLAFAIFCPLAGFEWISIMLSFVSRRDLRWGPDLGGKLGLNWSTGRPWNQVAFDRELPMPWDAATIDGHGSLAWVAVNSSKPQRERVPQCFMVFSTKQPLGCQRLIRGTCTGYCRPCGYLKLVLGLILVLLIHVIERSEQDFSRVTVAVTAF